MCKYSTVNSIVYLKENWFSVMGNKIKLGINDTSFAFTVHYVCRYVWSRQKSPWAYICMYEYAADNWYIKVWDAHNHPLMPLNPLDYYSIMRWSDAPLLVLLYFPLLLNPQSSNVFWLAGKLWVVHCYLSPGWSKFVYCFYCGDFDFCCRRCFFYKNIQLRVSIVCGTKLCNCNRQNLSLSSSIVVSHAGRAREANSTQACALSPSGWS